MSSETIRGYETRGTHPSRERLEALIAALKIPNATANQMRESAGYALLKTVHRGPHAQNRYYSLEELDAAVETVPWPEFVVNDATEVVAANAAVQALWHIDFAYERSVRTRAQMNLLAVASDNHFGDRVKNWEECVGILISMFKGDQPTPYSLDTPTPYFEEVIKEFIKGDPAFLSRLFDVWTRTEPMEGKIRWTYPVIWEDPEAGEMHFLARSASPTRSTLRSSTTGYQWMPHLGTPWSRSREDKTVNAEQSSWKGR